MRVHEKAINTLESERDIMRTNGGDGSIAGDSPHRPAHYGRNFKDVFSSLALDKYARRPALGLQIVR